jgi:L-ascorbate metabolism protein UlaG (beta-lactamase superfamily)
MKIKWLGHSSFYIEGSAGFRIVTDPYNNIGFEMPAVTADAVTISHKHYDHNNIPAVGGNPRVFDKEGYFDFNGIKFNALKTFHDDSDGQKRGENLIFKFDFEGIMFCHLGDIGHNINRQLIKFIKPVNVLMIPIGGKYTINAFVAREYVETLKPNIVIPMHFKTKGLNIDIDKPDMFFKLFKDNDIKFYKGGCLEINEKEIKGISPTVIVFSNI